MLSFKADSKRKSPFSGSGGLIGGNSRYKKDKDKYKVAGDKEEGYGFKSGVRASNLMFNRKSDQWRSLEAENIQAQARSMASKQIGRIDVQMDMNGNPLPYHIRNGKIYNTPKGLKVLDGSIIQEQKRLRDEAMQDVMDRVDTLLISRETTQTILGLSNSEYLDLFGSSPSQKWSEVFEGDDDLMNVNCEVSWLIMRFHNNDKSDKVTRAIMKLMKIAEFFVFDIDNSGLDTTDPKYTEEGDQFEVEQA